MSQRVDSADSKRGLPTYDMVVTSELPTYEQAQAMNENSLKYYQGTELPETPPPAWSPMHQTNLTAVPTPTQEFTQITIHEESNSSSPSASIYQIFNRSPNRVQRKF